MVTMFDTLGLPPKGVPIARVLKDIDPTLSLVRLPVGHPRLAEEPSKQFAVVHGALPPEGLGYIISTYPESMLDDRIIRAVIEGSAQFHHWDKNVFDPSEMAARLLYTRQVEDQREDAMLHMDYKMHGRKSW